MRRILFILLLFFLFNNISGCVLSTKKQVTIFFNSNEGTNVPSISDYYNQPVTKPEDPTKGGFSFDGWYIDNEFTTLYTFDKMPKDNLILYAKWTPNESFTITFDNNWGVSINPITKPFGSQIFKPIEPRRLGYIFEGWYIDSEYKLPFIFHKMPKDNIYLYAKWKPGEYTIKFNSNGGSDVLPIKGNINLTQPIAPVREGFTFDGWYIDHELKKEYKFEQLFYNITLYAKWTHVLDNGIELTAIDDKHCIVTDYNEIEENIIIPNNYSGCTIIKIDSSVFAHSNKLKSITIPNTITEIEKNSFSRTIGLRNVIFEEGSQLVSIGDFAFYYSGLEHIVFPSNLKTIGDSAFKGTNLFGLTIPNSVTNMDDSAFSLLSNLTSLTFEEGSQLTEIEESVFANATSLTTIILPDSIRTIKASAFIRNYSLTNLKLPSHLEFIGGSAFFDADNLSSVTFPNTLTSIGSDAFYSSGITDIFIPNRVIEIGEGAFEYNHKLTTVTFEEGSNLTEISPYLFSGATNLLNINLPDSIKTIGRSSFLFTTNLTSIALPVNLSIIDSNAFGESGLIEIIIPNSVTEIRDNAFKGIKATSITIPNNVSHLGDGAFSWNRNLITLDFEEGSQLQSFNSIIIVGTFKLETLNLPDSISQIDLNFSDTSLRSLTIPSSIKQIIVNPYSNVIVTEIILEAEVPPTISSGIKESLTDNFKIYVPEVSVNVYKNTANWTELSNQIISINDK